MRVIAGSRRSIPLVTIPGSDTRPTTDRIKETLFNILRDDVYGARVLDLFAGSGQLGIEALSRGADHAVFIEKNKKCIECIKQNVSKTKFEKESVILQRDLPAALSLAVSYGPYSLIFMDAPYSLGIEEDCIKAIGELGLLSEAGIIICETALGRELTLPEGFTISRIKTYKTNQHIFISTS
ncbi:MAG: 16S rRNA (guanine(966)-N(2))-methyltransferase RsmD [Lachnospiraceae bacterium]|nr:16S rRNA (guanine(966)-N(2))-methyltransferase RsmD [Lachnospiraceae bacterium]